MGFIGHQKSPFRTLKRALSQNRHRNTAQQYGVGRCIEKGEHCSDHAEKAFSRRVYGTGSQPEYEKGNVKIEGREKV